MDLREALELRKLRKAKYLKRTGSPGHYKYTYKEKKPISSKKYMKEHAKDIRKEADELRRMSEEDFKRKKEAYDKKKKERAGEVAIGAMKKIKEGKSAPKFTGDWNNDNQLKKYMKENKGKSFETVGFLIKVGQRARLAEDTDVGMTGYPAFVVADSGKGHVIICDEKKEIFDEVNLQELEYTQDEKGRHLSQ